MNTYIANQNKTR